MSFLDLNIALRYRSNEHDFPCDFLIPVLRQSVIYKRAVGFFSTSSLVDLSRGLFDMAERGGTVQLVCSPRLSEEDIKAINLGYRKRDEVIAACLQESLIAPINEFEEERLNLVATMISRGMLEIQLAFMETDTGINIYHEKMSVFIDDEGNRVAYSGSLNETDAAFCHNFESIFTFCSWKDKSQRDGVGQIEFDFDNIWENNTKKLNVIPFPKVALDRLMSYQKDAISFNSDTREYGHTQIRTPVNIAEIPSNVTLRPYQTEAVRRWFAQSCRGIMSMCTGAGKTFTAMAAAVRLGNKLNQKLGIFIVCPYIHLVSQWEEDLVEWGFSPIIAHSKSTAPAWQNALRTAFRRFRRTGTPFVCITTNDTFASNKIQPMIQSFSADENILLIVDEAHNFGTESLSACMPEHIKYRMALSATIERHMDKAGTKRLFEFFGEQCIIYGLDRAIQDGTLVPYEYYPIPVFLEDDELKRYQELSQRLKKFLVKKNGKLQISDAGKSVVYARTRLLAAARAKIPLLMSLLEPRKHEKNMLVYCGATTVEDEKCLTENRQIDVVTRKMREELHISVQRFTAEEGLAERRDIKQYFQDGLYQAITAIQCLDEGVNIPKICTAFILSSSRNPKQFIQRRGRLLRRSEGKDKAVIFDFVTLPRDLRDVVPGDYDSDRTIILGELARIHEFGQLANNRDESEALMDQIMSAYNIYINIEEETKRMEEYYGEE